MGLLPEDNSASLAPATGGLRRGWRWLGQGILGIMQIEETVLAVSIHAGEFVVKIGARRCLCANPSPYPFLLLYNFDPIKPEMDSYGAQ